MVDCTLHPRKFDDSIVVCDCSIAINKAKNANISCDSVHYVKQGKKKKNHRMVNEKICKKNSGRALIKTVIDDQNKHSDTVKIRLSVSKSYRFTLVIMKTFSFSEVQIVPS